MSTIKADAITASTGTNTNIAISGKGSGKVKLGDGNLLFPDADGSANQYIKTDGSANLAFATLPTAGEEFVSELVASTSSSLDFTNMVSGYDYIYYMMQVIPATDSTHLLCQMGISGPTYRTSGYRWSAFQNAEADQNVTAHFTVGGAFVGASELGSGSDEGIFCSDIQIHDPAGATFTAAQSRGAFHNAAAEYKLGEGGGQYGTAEAHPAVRFIMASGNITSGTIQQFRRKRS